MTANGQENVKSADKKFIRGTN